jgi:hypothetical protein
MDEQTVKNRTFKDLKPLTFPRSIHIPSQTFVVPDQSGTSSLAAAIPLRRHDNQPERRKAHCFIQHPPYDLATSNLHALRALQLSQS